MAIAQSKTREGIEYYSGAPYTVKIIPWSVMYDSFKLGTVYQYVYPDTGSTKRWEDRDGNQYATRDEAAAGLPNPYIGWDKD